MSRSTGASRASTVSPAGHQLGPWVIAVPVVGGADRRADGALRLAGDPRPRHPRGDGAGAAQREPHPAAHDVPQAAVGGDRDRHRRPVRRGGADHRHRRRARLAPRAVAARHRRRAQDAARRRRRGAAWRRRSAARCRRCCWRSSCCCSSTAPRSLIPVALARATATGVRIAFVGSAPVFAMPDLAAARRRRARVLRRCSAR